MKIKIFFFLCLLSVLSFGQVKTHIVEAQETVYGISQTYNIDQEDLIKANPFLQERQLQIGDELKIPSQFGEDQALALEPIKVENHEDKDFLYRVIKPKQTLYSLTKEYGVEKETITSLNPFIEDRGLQIGDVVRIPKKTNSTVIINTKNSTGGLHLVQAGETVYSIAKRYNLSIADIYAANKLVQTEGLKAGTYIKVPGKKEVVIKDNQFEHSVEKEETIFSIMRKYDVSLEELIAANPKLKNGLMTNMTLSIPMERNAIIEQEPTTIVSSAAADTDGEINVVMMLPFFLNQPNAFKGERQVAEDFFKGAQLALDDILKEGKIINVELVDTENDRQSIERFLRTYNIGKTDAIIGPFFQDMIAYTALRLNESEIPIFSPLINSTDIENFDNIYMATPREDFAIEQIAEEIKKDYKGETIKVLTTSSERPTAEKLQQILLKKLPSAEVIITLNANDLVLVKSTTTTYLEDGTPEETVSYEPIKAVLASENNKAGADFVNVIKVQKPEYIDGYGIFFVPAFDVFDLGNQSNIKKLKEIGMIYTASRMVNTLGANEKQILSAFEKKYCKKPNKYMALGYDLMYDVIDRMDKSGKLNQGDLSTPKTRLSSKIGYNTINGSKAKMNTELRIIRLRK